MAPTIDNVYAPGQFYLADGGEIPPVETWDQSNGLLVTASQGATLLCGEAWGRVQAAIETLDTAPARVASPPTEAPGSEEATDADDAAGGELWDDIVECTVICRTGPLQVIGDPGMDMPDLPRLDTAGPGLYRVRAHVRGRDTPGSDLDGFPVPADKFLLQVWPAPAAPPVIIKATDSRGASVRAGWQAAQR